MVRSSEYGFPAFGTARVSKRFPGFFSVLLSSGIETMLTRRTFVAGALATPFGLASARELRCDVAIVGGGVGACAAALGALRNGMRVILTEETDWIGGQLTSQAVPPDEHPYIESFGCTRAYRDYRERVRDYYRRNYPLTEAARGRRDFNPGNGRVSRLTHEPRVS